MLLELYATARDLLKYYVVDPEMVKGGYNVKFRYGGIVTFVELHNSVGTKVAQLDEVIQCFGDMELFIPFVKESKGKTDARPSRPRLYQNPGRPRKDGTSVRYKNNKIQE